MFGRKIALGERLAQPHRDQILGIGAEQAAFEAIEQRELLLRLQHRMIGNVVGGADEIVERQDRAAMARMNEKGRHREILVPMSLARAPIVGAIDAYVSHPSSKTPLSIGLRPALPHAAAAAGMLIGGIERERHIHRRDDRQDAGAQSIDSR